VTSTIASTSTSAHIGAEIVVWLNAEWRKLTEGRIIKKGTVIQRCREDWEDGAAAPLALAE
jgi:hypothetical protein